MFRQSMGVQLVPTFDLPVFGHLTLWTSDLVYFHVPVNLF